MPVYYGSDGSYEGNVSPLPRARNGKRLLRHVSPNHPPCRADLSPAPVGHVPGYTPAGYTGPARGLRSACPDLGTVPLLAMSGLEGTGAGLPRLPAGRRRVCPGSLPIREPLGHPGAAVASTGSKERRREGMPSSPPIGMQGLDISAPQTGPGILVKLLMRGEGGRSRARCKC